MTSKELLDHVYQLASMPLLDDIMWAILGDMAILSTKMRGWSCNSYWTYGEPCIHGTSSSKGKRNRVKDCLAFALQQQPTVSVA